ncbi:hypothetical protein [Arthrobacter sp. BE255]|uniref:hypothetical protein n=1 Tax=Arthrobacter sp. BE255 TaxID=2817721 RepID=UPI00285E33B9|nr:hypothetical protein [Arthrobacter sp. BE255]MDR7161399.1 hypothetical protein [Arthrobacter sp. BE255]
MLNEHWERRGLPNWANIALNRTGEVAAEAVNRVTDAVPEMVKEPIRRAGDAIANTSMRPGSKAWSRYSI